MNQASCALIAKAVQEFLNGQTHINTKDLETVRECLRSDSPCDYERFALPFAAAFWTRNFWKASYFFNFEYVKPAALKNPLLRPGSSFEITVLGAGSAADTAACLAWLDEELPLHKVQLVLVDSCKEQLVLARRLLEISMRYLHRLEVEITYGLLSADTWSPHANSIDLLVMSHFLTEVPRSATTLVPKIVDALKPRGDVIIVERERDPVWEVARHALALAGVTTHEVSIRERKLELLAPPSQERDITPLYVRGNMPENKQLMRLVRKYFDAWLQRSSESLTDVFTSDATYDEKPALEPTIVGIDGIRRYWDKHPGLQRNIALNVHAVTYSDTVSVCSFSGEFDTPKQHIAIRGAINFFLDPYAGKFHRLAEYFGTVKTPHGR